jgi:hypothetical protein
MSKMPNRPNMSGMPPGFNPAMAQQMRRNAVPTESPSGPPSKEQFNPLPDGKGAVQVLKAHAGCQMPREAATLNALMQKTQEVDVPPGHENDLYVAMSESIALVFRAESECSKHVSTRTAGLFNEDPEMKDMSDKCEALFNECTSLEEQLKAKVNEYNTISTKRWERAIKAFGLNVQERFYRVDAPGRAVQQIELKCDECQAIKQLKDARQRLTRVLMSIDATNRKEAVTFEPEVKDATTSDGHGTDTSSSDGSTSKPDGQG